jgi:signal transduction histidine kinase
MRKWLRQRLGVRSLSLTLSVVLCGATAGLAWLTYRATRANETATRQLLDERVRITRDFVARALMRNMKGVTSVLLTVDPAAASEDPPSDLHAAFARAFARFDYPETFFVGNPGSFYVFHRGARVPAWAWEKPPENSEPVLMQSDPPGAQALLVQAREELSRPSRARDELARRSRLAVFEWNAGTEPYQVVVRRVGNEEGGLRFVGFTVSHRWTREHYFRKVVGEVVRIGSSGAEDGHPAAAVAAAVVDEERRTVAATDALAEGTVEEKTFPLAFYDPALSSTLVSYAPPEWRIRVGATPGWDHTRRIAVRRTLLLLVAAVVLALVALLLTLRAARAREELAEMKSDFVATVTHELKTPLASIRAASDAIALGHYDSAKGLGEYSLILSQETGRLARLIDNLLTVARSSEEPDAYSMKALDVAELIEGALESFRLRLANDRYEVIMDVPVDLPNVRADHSAMLHVLENLIDNAVKYSDDVRHLTISARAEGQVVRVAVSDRGRGIPEADQARVFDRFYRGSNARAAGGGLGLAIVRRVVVAHGGRAEVTSEIGRGTTVSVILPAVAV